MDFIAELNKMGLPRNLYEAVSSGYSVLFEGASPVLYHFTTAGALCQMIRQNRFTPSHHEISIDGGKRFMSFSRTGNFDEGWPALFYSSSTSDDWCMIRLTVDGDMFNRRPNVRDSSGRQHAVKFRPADWLHAVGVTVPGVEGRGMNGKEQMLASTAKRTHKFTGKTVPDRQAHPWAQSEDRLLTDSDQIPDFMRYVKRIDVVLRREGWENSVFDCSGKRRALAKWLKTIEDTGKVHVFASLADFRKGNECPIEAIAPKAINESTIIESTSNDGSTATYYRGFNSADLKEDTVFSKLSCPGNGMWITPFIEYAIVYASHAGGAGRVARITINNAKIKLATCDDLDECGLMAENAIDASRYTEEIDRLRENGFNAFSNYCDDSDDGYYVIDPSIIEDIHVMTPEELGNADVDMDELEWLDCAGWYRDYTSKDETGRPAEPINACLESSATARLVKYLNQPATFKVKASSRTNLSKPAYNYFTDAHVVNGVWAVHFTGLEAFEDIQESGFKNGTRTLDNLAYSANYSDSRRGKLGWLFALPLDCPYLDNYDLGYGDCGFLIKTNGVRARHIVDGDDEILFRGRDVLEKIPIIFDEDYDRWFAYLDSGKTLKNRSLSRLIDMVLADFNKGTECPIDTTV